MVSPENRVISSQKYYISEAAILPGVNIGCKNIANLRLADDISLMESPSEKYAINSNTVVVYNTGQHCYLITVGAALLFDFHFNNVPDWTIERLESCQFFFK